MVGDAVGRRARVLASAPMIRRCAIALVHCATAAAVAAQDADATAGARDTGAWIERLAVRDTQRDVVQQLVRLGPAALPVLHRALGDRRPEVVCAALFACSALPGDVESLREPLLRHLHHRDLGIALAARDAWPVLDGRGRTLVADYQAGAVLEIAADGVAHELAHEPMVMSASRLVDGNLLVAAYQAGRVIEHAPGGAVVWSCDGLLQPSDAERLPDGHTLIADSGNQRVIEVDARGEIVWTYAHDIRPIDVDRLGNGDTLIASYHASGCVEVDPHGEVVWQWPSHNVRDADRLCDGTTLLVLPDEHKVALVRSDKTIAREWRIPFDADDAQLLANGHLLAAGEGWVMEWNAAGDEVWKAPVRYAGRVARLGVAR